MSGPTRTPLKNIYDMSDIEIEEYLNKRRVVQMEAARKAVDALTTGQRETLFKELAKRLGWSITRPR